MKKILLSLFILILIIINPYQLLPQDNEMILLDTMNNNSGWVIGKDQDTSGGIITKNGKIGNSTGIEYDLSQGNWIQIHKDIKKNLDKLEVLSLYIKTDGEVNNLEVKLTDDADCNYGIVFRNFSTDNKWKNIIIQKSDFKYIWGDSKKLNWKNITRFWIAVSKSIGGKGNVLVDNIEYKVKEDLFKLEGKASKMIIENFERSDPYKVYIPILNDESSLDLRSVNSYIIEGNYSMELYYSLSTKKSSPTSISAAYEFLSPLNWNNINTLNIWVRGDSTRNIFKIGIVDGSQELWEYSDYTVLYDNKWTLIRIPFDKFKLTSKKKINNKKFDKSAILGIQYTVEGKSPEDSKGKIYIDKFYAVGKSLTADNIIPEEIKQPIILKRPQGNIDVKGDGIVEYKWTPEISHTLGGYVKLKFNAHLDKFGVYTELTTQSIEFGKSTYIDIIDGKTYLRENKPGVEISSIQFSIRKPVKYINEIIIGNLFENFSDYTFSVNHTDYGEWGYKGVKIQGGISDLSYRLMGIKQMFDSYVFGGEVLYNYSPLYVKGIYVINNNRGHIQNSGNINPETGIINNNQTGDFRSKQIYKDKVYTAETGIDLMGQKLHLNFLAGENYYRKYGEAQADTYNDYIYQYSYEHPIVKVGHIYKAELQLRSLFWQGLDIYTHVRAVDKDYKPDFRRKPPEFDQLVCEQHGINGRISQGFSGWVISSEADTYFRKSSGKYYRHWYKHGFTKYNFYDFDFSIYQTLIYQFDKFYVSRDNNENTVDVTLQHYTMQIVYKISSKLRILEEQNYSIQKERAISKRSKSLNFRMFLEYFLSHNARCRFEGLWQKYGIYYWEPFQDPYDDNYYKFIFEINF